MPGSHEAGFSSVRAQQLELHVEKSKRKRSSCNCWCFLRWYCCVCCCCLVLLLIALGIAAFFFWPRLLTVCLHSANTTAVVRLTADPSSSADASVDAAISEAKTRGFNDVAVFVLDANARTIVSKTTINCPNLPHKLAHRPFEASSVPFRQGTCTDGGGKFALAPPPE